MVHTSGPWFVGAANLGKDFLVYAKGPDGPLHIAEVFEHQSEDVLHGPSEANARLIAKAWLIPDLVEALDKAREWMCPPTNAEDYPDGGFPEAYELVADVLAKAKGDTYEVRE